MLRQTLSLVSPSLLVAITWGLAAPVCNGQQPADQESRGVNIFLPAPRDFTQRLSRAKKAIADERFSDAVSELGELLRELDAQPEGAPRAEGFESQDYFMGTRGEGGTFVSLKSEAQRLLGSMPPKGREWYELQYGALARALLDEAVNTGDFSKLADASRLYFHTKSGYEATMLLGRYHLDHGRPLAAALCFKRVADAPAAATAFEPELSMLLATCWLYSNMPDKVESLLTSLDKRVPRNQLKVAGRDIDVGANKEEALKWLQQIVGKRQALGGSEETQWAMFRGNATRTALSAAGLVLSSPRWKVPTVNDPNDEDLVRRSNKNLSSSGNAALPSLHSLVVDDMVLMRSPERLIAIDFKTGKRVSVYPWDDASTSPSLPVRSTGQTSTNVRANELQQRLWEDSPYGQISSDGNFVYLIDELGYVSANGNMPFFVMARGQLAANRGFPKPYNQLVALELKTQLKIQWKVGDADGQEEPRLAGAFFLGPPLPLQGQLYVLAEFNGEIRLVVLNAKTGQMVWQQQLAHMDNLTVQIDAGRRLAGASPSFADGVLICPTSGGAIVAVDISTRRLLWGYQYGKTQPEGRGNVFWRGTMMAAQRPIGARWTDATATISDGRVIVSPPESDELYCLDLLTGKLLWPAKKREDMLYVGGVHAGKLILVGKNRLQAINMADGKAAWDKPVEIGSGSLVTGRGLHADRFYFLPTSTSEIVKVDLDTAKVVGNAKIEDVPGNLISYKDEVISQSPFSLTSYLMVDPLRKRVAAALQKNAEDGVALARLGEIELHDGRRTEALTALRKAHSLEPTNDAIRTVLVKTMLMSLRDDFTSNRELAKEIEELIEQPSQRIEFYRLMAGGLQKVGELDAAFEMFAKLIEATPSLESSRDLTPPQEQVERHLAVRLDRWVMARLSELHTTANSEQRKKMDALIETQLQRSISQNGVAGLRRFVDHFAFHPTADAARLELGRRLRDAEDLLEAEQQLARLTEHADSKISASANLQLAKLFTHAKQFELASIFYQRLQEKFADIDCGDGRTGNKCLADAAEEKDLKLFLAGERIWAYGRADVKEAGQPSTPRFQNLSVISTVPMPQVQDPVVPGMSIVWDAQRNQSIILRDGLGRETGTVSLAKIDPRGQVNYYNTTLHQARVMGHLVFVQPGSEVVAVNTLRTAKRGGDSVLWREDLAAAPTDGNDPFGGARYSSQIKTLPFGLTRPPMIGPNGQRIGSLGPVGKTGVIVQRMRELVCLDPFTGQPIWTRSNVEIGSDVWGDQERLFLVPPAGKEAIAISTLDGRELGRRPIPVQDQRLATHETRVLVGAEVDGQLSLKLLDPWTEKELFSKTFATGSKGAMVGTDEFAVMQPDGNFTLISLRDGEPIVIANLEAETGLEAIRVLRSSDQYVLVTARQTTSTPGFVGFNAPIFLRIGNGRVYAFDRQTGKTQWQVPAEIKDVALPIDQPTEVPVLLFLGGSVARTQNRSGNASSSLLCIDKRDGRTVMKKDGLTTVNYVYEMTGDPSRKYVRVSLQSKSFEIHLTNEPTPPEPPAQATPKTDATSSTRGVKLMGDLLERAKLVAGDLFEEPQPVAAPRAAQPIAIDIE